MSGKRRSISGIEGKSPSFRPPRYRYSGSVQRSSKNPETCTPSPSASFSEVFRMYLRLSMNSRKPPLSPASVSIRLSMRDSSFKSFRGSEACSLASVSVSVKSRPERSLWRASDICLKVPLSFRDSSGLSFLNIHLNSFSVSGRMSLSAGLLTFDNVLDKPSHELLPLIIPE